MPVAFDLICGTASHSINPVFCAQVAIEDPQAETLDDRPGLLAAFPGMTISGPCPPPDGCGKPIKPDGKCGSGCSVGALRQTLGEFTALHSVVLALTACAAVKANKQSAALVKKSAKGAAGAKDAVSAKWALKLRGGSSLIGERHLNTAANQETRYCCSFVSWLSNVAG